MSLTGSPPMPDAKPKKPKQKTKVKSKKPVALVLTTQQAEAAKKLPTEMMAVRLQFSNRLSTRRTFTEFQKTEAAALFDAVADAISASKKLYDSKDAKLKRVHSAVNTIKSYWKSVTIPFPEDATRLIRTNRIEEFEERMKVMVDDLREAVADLQTGYDNLKALARVKLGNLYDDRDYPETLEGFFKVNWDYPNVEPPQYLLKLNPAAFERQQAQLRAKFEEAVILTEQALMGELQKLVTHMVTTLADPTAKFKDSLVTNFHDFFDRFQSLNIRSNPELENMIKQAKRIVGNQEADYLRHNDFLRNSIAAEMSKVQKQVDEAMTTMPTRKIYVD